jgi:voltage-gated potassium channel
MLMLLFILYPIFKKTHGVVFDILFGAVTLASIWALSQSHYQLVIAVVLAVPALASNYFNYRQPDSNLFIVCLISQYLLLGYVMLMILVYILSTRRVTVDTIAGSVCIYLILGLVWGFIYTMVDVLNPGLAFSGIETDTFRGGLAALQAIMGQFYIAILVAPPGRDPDCTADE